MASSKTCSSSIGKKFAMAVTGLALMGFVVMHLAGNLSVFFGQSAMNHYAHKLEGFGPLLRFARVMLIGIVCLHIYTSIKITIENRRARPVPYSYKDSIAASYAAKTMMFSGLIILTFIIYHLLHFTFRVTNPEISNLTDAEGLRDVYSMVVLSFQNPVISAAYILAMILLGMHLSHGFSSLFQSLGANNEKWIPCLKRTGCAFAFLIFAGYISIPLSVLFGVLKAGVPS